LKCIARFERCFRNAAGIVQCSGCRQRSGIHRVLQAGLVEEQMSHVERQSRHEEHCAHRDRHQHGDGALLRFR
jgi:hypothetical protein